MTPDDRKSPTTPTDDARGPKPSGAHPHVRRVFLAATATPPAFVMVVAAIVMGGYFWASASIPTSADPPPSASGSTGPEDIAGTCDERACNYLLLGSDSRKGLTPEEHHRVRHRRAYRRREPLGHDHPRAHATRPEGGRLPVVPARPVGRHPGDGGGQDQLRVRGRRERRRSATRGPHDPEHQRDADPPRAVRQPARVPAGRRRARRRRHVRPVPDEGPADAARHPGRLPALRRADRARVRPDAAPAVRHRAGLRADQPAAAVPARGDREGARSRASSSSCRT